MKDKTCNCCGEPAPFSNYCGAYVCQSCDAHVGMARCYCGWAAGGGDGYTELVEWGETIEPEEDC